MSTLSIILSIALALSAVFSPIFVAIINNRNTAKLRIAEFNHLEEIKKWNYYNILRKLVSKKNMMLKMPHFRS